MSSLNEYLRFIVTLTAVVDPFLAVPMFIAIAGGQPLERRVHVHAGNNITPGQLQG